ATAGCVGRGGRAPRPRPPDGRRGRWQLYRVDRPPGLRPRSRPEAAKPLTIGGPLPGVLPDMIVLEGLPALSPFRRERLELRLQSVSPGVRIAGAWHVYWIDPDPGASPDPAVLRRVLEAGDDRAAPASGSISRFVAPRLGTISPWA